MLRNNLSSIANDNLAPVLFKRNRYLKGSLRVVKIKFFTAEYRNTTGFSRAGWRLFHLEADADFLQSLHPFSEDHLFPLGVSGVIIRGGTCFPTFRASGPPSSPPASTGSWTRPPEIFFVVNQNNDCPTIRKNRPPEMIINMSLPQTPTGWICRPSACLPSVLFPLLLPSPLPSSASLPTYFWCRQFCAQPRPPSFNATYTWTYSDTHSTSVLLAVDSNSYSTLYSPNQNPRGTAF